MAKQSSPQFSRSARSPRTTPQPAPIVDLPKALPYVTWKALPPTPPRLLVLCPVRCSLSLSRPYTHISLCSLCSNPIRDITLPLTPKLRLVLIWHTRHSKTS